MTLTNIPMVSSKSLKYQLMQFSYLAFLQHRHHYHKMHFMGLEYTAFEFFPSEMWSFTLRKSIFLKPCTFWIK